MPIEVGLRREQAGALLIELALQLGALHATQHVSLSDHRAGLHVEAGDASRRTEQRRMKGGDDVALYRDVAHQISARHFADADLRERDGGLGLQPATHRRVESDRQEGDEDAASDGERPTGRAHPSLDRAVHRVGVGNLGHAGAKSKSGASR